MYALLFTLPVDSPPYTGSHQYYNRWANHEQSAKLSKEVYAKTEKKMEEMQITSELTWIEVQFARKAVDEVERCRTTLKWTYAMAFYLDKGNEKELFEDNQRCVFIRPKGFVTLIKFAVPFTGTWKKRLRIYRSC